MRIARFTQTVKTKSIYIVIPKNTKSLHFSDIIFKIVYKNYQAKLDKTKASKLEHRSQKAPVRTKFSAFNTRYLAIFNLKYKSQVDKRTYTSFLNLIYTILIKKSPTMKANL